MKNSHNMPLILLRALVANFGFILYICVAVIGSIIYDSYTYSVNKF